MRRDELIGRTIANRFRIQRVLGEGGMATVFVAEQDAEPREVALKILRAELTSDKTFAKRFEREAKAAARVQHPNSVTIFDAGVEGSLSYIAMELLRGDDLYALLERHGALSPRAAATILAEVCDALAVAHGLGIVHRDLKPENIMIVRDPSAPDPGGPESAPMPPGTRVKVLDFGIAKLLDKQSDSPGRRDDRLDPPSAVTAVTRVGTLIGTPAYMSPEQCALLPVDTRSDIYTCGVLLFQLVTGRLPFEGPTPLHIATKHIHEDPPPLRSICPEAEPALEALVLKTLAKRATERYQTARHLGSTLRKLLPELTDVPYRSAVRSREIDEITTGSYSVDVAMASAGPEAIASAKTVVANGLGGPPPSVFVHGAVPRDARAAPAPEPAPDDTEPTVESEPEDLAATLVRGSFPDADELADTRDSRSPVADRQLTMQSAASPAATERAARISVIDAPPAPRVSVIEPPPAPVVPAPLAPPSAPIPPPSMGPSVILAPSLSAPPAPPVAVPLVPPVMPPVAVPAQAAPPPTFGLPSSPAAAPAPPALAGRTLWIGILIGTGVSTLLFALAYLLFLAR